jgi:GT2 family glycosyltransferase
MKVSVIVVTYNGLKWIDKCLSALSKSVIEHRVIVIDNASTDGTPGFIRKNYQDITLLEQPQNLGFGIANNIGLSLAIKENCDYVFLLNQDAYISPETIHTLIKVANKNKNYGIICPVHLDGTGDKLNQSFVYYLKKDGKNDLLSDFVLNKKIKNIYSFNMINAAAWLLPVKTLNIVGGFHPIFFLYGEDDNYCQRVLYHGLEIGVVPSAYIIHDSDNNNLNLPKEGSDKYFEKFLNLIKIRYANVNTNEFEDIKSLERFYFKISLKALFKFDIKNFQLNLRKSELIGKMDFSKDIEEGRKSYRNYLDLKN